MTNVTPLQAYLDRKGMTASALAEQMIRSVSTITRVANGERKPSRNLAQAIEKATEGEVTAAALLEGAA